MIDWIILILFLSVIPFTILTVPWYLHVSRTIDKSNGVFGFCGLFTFLRYMSKVEPLDAKFNRHYKESYFGDDLYYKDGVLKFDNKGMIIHNPISYWIVRFYISSFIQNNSPYIARKYVEW